MACLPQGEKGHLNSWEGWRAKFKTGEWLPIVGNRNETLFLPRTIFHGEPQLPNTEEEQTTSLNPLSTGSSLWDRQKKSLPSAPQKSGKLSSVCALTQRKSLRGGPGNSLHFKHPWKQGRDPLLDETHKAQTHQATQEQAGPEELRTHTVSTTARDEHKERFPMQSRYTISWKLMMERGHRMLVHPTQPGKGNYCLHSSLVENCEQLRGQFHPNSSLTTNVGKLQWDWLGFHVSSLTEQWPAFTSVSPALLQILSHNGWKL